MESSVEFHMSYNDSLDDSSDSDLDDQTVDTLGSSDSDVTSTSLSVSHNDEQFHITPTIRTITSVPPLSSINYQTDRTIHYISVINTTATLLLDSLTQVHQANQHKASKIFLTQHAKHLAALPSTTFETFGHAIFHVDGGVNVSAVLDRIFFYFFIPCLSSIEQVGGDTIFC